MKANAESPAKKTVPVMLFHDNGNYSGDVFVSVNGENYMIRRGVQVEVPGYVAEVLENTRRQDERTRQYIETAAERCRLRERELR